ncbi:hypothetical protein COT72_00645 [archaeon CG10_big_fil_rev_8_21_14_0_10_43_11]|nr:MAG: hypothetical protein COT72_00645 [archaeon CG10_big_fil_rev_8_21_14_0_10_43_11]
MKIAIYTISTYPHLGGMTSHMQELQAGLNALGNKTDCFGFPLSVIINAPKKVYHKNRDTLTQARTFHLMSSLFILFRELFFIFVMNFFVLYKHVRNHYDLYMTQDAVAFHSSFLVRTFFRKRVSLTVHGYYVDEKIADNKLPQKSPITWLLYKIEHAAYKRAACIFSVDSRIKDYIVSTLKKDPGIVVLKNFVNTDFFKPLPLVKNKAFSALCARRFVEKNGVVFAVEAMKYMPKGYELICVGEGQTKPDLMRVIEKNKLTNVTLLDGRPREEMPQLLNRVHVALVPSISIKGVEEATSISALEAMSCAIPVIASNIGGLKEIVIDGKTGFLVDDKNPKQIAQKIKELKEHPSLLKKMGKRARKLVEEHYSHTQRAKEYLKHVRG